MMLTLRGSLTSQKRTLFVIFEGLGSSKAPPGPLGTSRDLPEPPGLHAEKKEENIVFFTFVICFMN